MAHVKMYKKVKVCRACNSPPDKKNKKKKKKKKKMMMKIEFVV
jgi:hypothetical protein